MLVAPPTAIGLPTADISANSAALETASPGGAPPHPDIVVTARSANSASDVVETSFGQGEIAAQGTDDIRGLLSRLQPLISPDGTETILLVNGRPAGFDQSILSYPPEALEKINVLKPGSGTKYGAPSNQRVVNLVLKRNFSSLVADAGANTATAGGEYGGDLSATVTKINGETRWSAQVHAVGTSDLLRSSRNVAEPAGTWDRQGLVSAPDGSEIDSALSAMVGTSTYVTEVPNVVQAFPSLYDFANSANSRSTLNPNAYETLQPSARRLTENFGITHPLGNFSLSASINGSQVSGRGLSGIPLVTLNIPAGNPWTPFAQTVVLNRPFDGSYSLGNRNSQTAFSTSLTLDGPVLGVQSSIALSFSHSKGDNVIQTGVDTASMQALLDADDAAFNPFGKLARNLIESSTTRSTANDLTSRLNMQRSVQGAPAGPISLGLSVSASRAASQNINAAYGAATNVFRSVYSQIGEQFSLDIPISRRKSPFAFLGNLSVNIKVGAQSSTGSPTEFIRGAGFSWSPIPSMQISGFEQISESTPSNAQLNGPIVTTLNNVFDYSRGEEDQVAWETGGNPELKRGRRTTVSLSAVWRPLGSQALSLNMAYQSVVALDNPADFPELTPAVETAFPDRIIRNGAGVLIAVDARSINIQRNETSSINSRISLRWGGAPTHHHVATDRGIPSDPIYFDISLDNTFWIKNEMAIAPGIPAINQIGGGSGVSRLNATLQADVSKRSCGVTASVTWSSHAHIDGTDTDFLVTPPLLVSMSSFLNVDQFLPPKSAGAFQKGLRISFSIQNIFDSYRHLRLADGNIPVGYTHDEADPLGRTAQIQIRKMF